MFARKLLRGAGWMAASAYANLAISFIGNLVLARILIPDDFGVYALAASVLSLVFLAAGFGSSEAIVQNRDKETKDLVATAFWMTMALSLLLAASGTIVGVLLQDRYESIIIQLLVVLSWTRVFNNMAAVHRSILQRDFQYRPIAVTFFVSNLLAFSSAAVAAYFGLGTWALAVRDIVLMVTNFIGLSWSTKYLPSRTFRFETARWIWNFGWRMLILRANDTVFGRLDKLVIGSAFGTTILGHYNLAYRLTYLGNQFTQGAIQPVVFSAFSALQSSSERLQFTLERMNYWLWRLSVLMGVVVLLAGHELVVLIYGEKWALAGRIFQAMFLWLAIFPLARGLQEFLVGTGNINSVMHTRIVQLIIFVPGIFLMVEISGLFAVVWLINSIAVLGWLLMAREVSRLVNVNWLYLIKGPMIAVIVAVGIGLLLPYWTAAWNSLWFSTIAQVLAIVAVYALVLFLVEGKHLLAELRIVHTRAR